MALPNPPPPADDQEKRERLKALSEALGVNNIMTEIDSLKDNVGYLRGKMEELINAFNADVASRQQGPASVPVQIESSPSTVPMNDRMAQIQAMVPLVEGIGRAWAAFKGGGATQATSGLDLRSMGEEFIGLLMKTSMDKLLMSTYDVHVPAPQKYIDRVSQLNVSHDPQ